MKLTYRLLALVLFSAVLAPAAQALPAYRDDRINRGEVSRFDNFLDSHPQIDRDLRRNPRLIDDNDYVAAHPELREYLGAHPEIRQDLRHHPNKFMKREAKYERKEEKRENKWRRHWR